jgi:hypothetical protein
MNTINDTRSTLDKYMPWLIALLAAFLAGKALKRMFWTAFALYWPLHAMWTNLF